MKSGSQSFSSLPEAQNLAAIHSGMLRTTKHVNEDGSFELGWGTMLLCAGLVPYLNAALPKWFWSSSWTSWLSYLPLAVMAFAPYAIPKIIKRFITWPRTGYVENANELKLPQLLKIMAFGLALGFGIGYLFPIVLEVREFLNHTGPSNLRKIGVLAGKCLFCLVVAVYLGRKCVTKRLPVPGAYNPEILAQRLKQTSDGRTCLRRVRLTLLLLFLGAPLVAGAIVFGLICLSRSALHRTQVQWPEVAALSFIVATNAILYLMGNAVAIRQHRWKWLFLAVLIIGPIFVASAIPYIDERIEFVPMLKLFPPPVTLFMGLVWFLSGALALLVFIRRNPVASAETE